ncbi:hypothetical protein [Marinilactibacillus psychrotolerans]|uniref:Uncharacterized protein n=1 Tax=Marinilactibacillus psychrotolerans TaxID=191770 RepID=A0AAV3WSU5_9LACT|nr:hypothetical protein [Marinilactibacillus psychrotolerans]GEL66198.1 hypothetical protein MPS01_03530 [Marinilactibacillus psychrotolerans]GEQ34707.1 hypothetical protein M132T_02150 [Marinilactibacillus psychrotolerans]SDB94993.1 hypothetical protein SAMN04488013_1012 [Marinilactibacillus psychrotolerans]
MTSKKSSSNKIEEGFGLAIAFIIISLILLLDIVSYDSQTLKFVISAITGSIGVVGLGGLEINNFTGKSFNIDNITIGLFFVALYISASNFFDGDIYQTLILILLLFGIYGLATGCINLLMHLVNSENSMKRNVYNFTLFIIEIIGGISAIVSIAEIFI